tara:strand:+ start:1186 stop:1437 length:252 start_codon:yes stop_codon:yes gene_type:complete
MDEKRNYQRNYYINKRNYIRGLDKKDRDQLTAEELLDLDKYIHKFRPRTSRISRRLFDNSYIGGEEKIYGMKKETKQIIIYFE